MARKMQEAEYEQKQDRYFLLSLRHFFAEVSVVGARYITKENRGSVRRLTWSLLICFGIGFAFYQIYEQTRYYLAYPVSVKMNITDMPALKYPTVTVCNENFINKSFVMELDPSGNLSWAMSETLPPVTMSGTTVLREGMLDIFAAWDTADWETLIHRLYMDYNHLLIQCRFDGLPCDHSALSTVITNAGRCLQFNPNGNLTTEIVGSVNGLQLVLSAGVEYYNNPLSPSAGYRIYIHHHSEVVKNNVLSHAFKVDVNHHTQVKIQSQKIKRLHEPYGTCSSEEGYSYSHCSVLCYEKYILENCGCGWPSYITGNVSVCTVYKSSTCLLPLATRYNVERLESSLCACPHQCIQQLYPYQISSGKISDYFINWMQRVYTKRNYTAEYIEKNLAFIDIFYDSLQNTEMVTQEAYSLLSLLCDIGGALGLILGSTILTFFEILDFLIISGYDYLWKDASKCKLRKQASLHQVQSYAIWNPVKSRNGTQI